MGNYFIKMNTSLIRLLFQLGAHNEFLPREFLLMPSMWHLCRFLVFHICKFCHIWIPIVVVIILLRRLLWMKLYSFSASHSNLKYLSLMMVQFMASYFPMGDY